ncbi:MAG: hypothetical protein LBS72_08255 [Oscillospiraceae bacterium]|jgi:hypothetical protein|nr:hypothetical protein [Oscillospiraceae bacterium]
MSQSDKRRALAQSYKAQTASGGIYRFIHQSGWRSTLRFTSNLEGERNKLRLYKTAGSTSDIELIEPWRMLGAEGFDIEIVEALNQKEGQSAEDYKNDLIDLFNILKKDKI